jgi:Ni,Fe-hydrogenase maturation factor
VDVFACHQLTPELALKLAEASLVLFFDAALDLAPDHVACLPVEPASWSAASHHLSPGELVDLAGQIGGAAPPVFLITGGAGQTDLAEGLTAAGEQTAARMANAAEVLLRERTSAQFFLRTPVAAGH